MGEHAGLRLEAGVCAHRHIGWWTDLRRASDQFKRVLLAWMAVLAAAAAALAVRGGL